MNTYWHIETDVFALLVFIALLIKSYWIKRDRTFQDRSFSLVMMVSVLSTAIDIVSSAAMNGVDNWWFYQISMILYAVSVPVMAFMWIVYTLFLIFPRSRKLTNAILIMAIPYLIYVAICFTNPFTSLMFNLTPDFVYTRGPLFFIMGVGEDMLYSLIGFVLLAIFRKRIRPRYNIVLLAVFYSATAASLWVQLSNPGWLIIYATYAVVYVICDATIEEQRRQQLYDTIQEKNTELESAVKRAEEASAAKSQFLSRMSHDIRTPINGVMGMAMLALDNANPPDTVHCLKNIESSCEFLLGLVNDTLDMAKVESGKIELHPEPYTVAQFTGYIESIIEPMCEQKGITLVKSLNPIPGNRIMVVDRLRINQVFFNLLSNAVKFTPEGGRIELASRVDMIDDERIMFYASVEDNGIGMGDEFQKHMFDTFTQEEQEILPQRNGSGLGLSIVKAMMELMGGSVSVKSELGKGSRFSIEAPLTTISNSEMDTKQAPANDGAADVARLKGMNVLLVEDHPLNQEIGVRLLKKIGVNVITADNGKIAVHEFAGSMSGYYAAILMDIRMPVMDGLTAARRIRALNRADAAGIPIIAMTANALDSDREACLNAGMNAHISKPIIPAALYKMLAQTISAATATHNVAPK